MSDQPAASAVQFAAVAVAPPPSPERSHASAGDGARGEVPVDDTIDPWAFVSAHLHNLSALVAAIRDVSATIEIDQLPSLIRSAADVIEDGIDSAVFAAPLPDTELPVVVVPDSPSDVQTLIEDALAMRMMYRVMSPAEAAVAMTASGWTPGRVDRAATLHFAITRAVEDTTDVAGTGASASRVIAELQTTDADVIRLLVRKGLSEGQIDDYLRAYDWKSDRLCAAWMDNAA